MSFLRFNGLVGLACFIFFGNSVHPVLSKPERLIVSLTERLVHEQLGKGEFVLSSEKAVKVNLEVLDVDPFVKPLFGLLGGLSHLKLPECNLLVGIRVNFQESL